MLLRIGFVVALVATGLSPAKAQEPYGPDTNNAHRDCFHAHIVPSVKADDAFNDQIWNGCAETFNIFYCFPSHAARKSEKCGAAIFNKEIAGFSRLAVGRARAATDNVPYIFGCPAPLNVVRDGDRLNCK